MKKKNLFPTFLLLLLLPTVIIVNGDLIDQTCKKTPWYDLCRSTLHSDPQTSAAADVRVLATGMAQICLSKATDTLDRIKELIKESTDPHLEQSLAFCDELYIPVVKYSLPQAIDALSKGQYAFALDGISDARKQADACDAKFSGKGPSPVSDMNDVVRSLADVAAAIVDLLLHM